MSGLNLNADESKLLINEGWTMTKEDGDLYFFMDFGQRQIEMGPILKRNLNPMSFGTQARRYDNEYSEVAAAVGWQGGKFFPGKNSSEAMEYFKIETFDADFAKKITAILKDYALNVDPKKLVADRIERRKAVRLRLISHDFIDYAYLRRTEDLEEISLAETDVGREYLSPEENSEYLKQAIEVSKRP